MWPNICSPIIQNFTINMSRVSLIKLTTHKSFHHFIFIQHKITLTQTNLIASDSQVFRSGRISSVYIVVGWLLVGKSHFF